MRMKIRQPAARVVVAIEGITPHEFSNVDVVVDEQTNRYHIYDRGEDAPRATVPMALSAVFWR